MSASEELGFAGRALELRAAFDRAFARAPLTAREADEDFLSIRLASDRYVLRLAEVAGLFADRAVTPLPTSAPGFRGLAGFRGAVLPVYELRALLGYPPGEGSRWLVTAQGAPLAFAIDAFEGHMRTPRSAVAALAQAGSTRQHVREVLHTGGLQQPIVQLGSVCQEISRGVAARAHLGG